jgi:NRPS condensation-like uncharacterized protein
MVSTMFIYDECIIIYRVYDMYVTNVKPEEYKRSYPTFKTCRLSHRNLERIRKYNKRYQESINDIMTRILDLLDEYQRRGYETKEENSSW